MTAWTDSFNLVINAIQQCPDLFAQKKALIAFERIVENTITQEDLTAAQYKGFLLGIEYGKATKQ